MLTERLGVHRTVILLDVKPMHQNVGDRFGMRLREMRRARKMTQVELAVHLGINRSYISDVECGKKGISLATLEVIALGLHVKLSDLFQGL